VTTTLAALGWHVTEETDERGRSYYRAYRGAYVRGAHDMATLAAMVEATHEATVEHERMTRYTLHHGDCLEVLRTLPEPSQPTAPPVVQASLFEETP
jgi:hypothetical protein